MKRSGLLSCKCGWVPLRNAAHSSWGFGSVAISACSLGNRAAHVPVDDVKAEAWAEPPMGRDPSPEDGR